ncbi:MAG: glycogen/starch synthase, partial [Phycisphaerales bacterium]|nr:glycogen/starch synthase [Phycisphaerales bacterium]
MRILMLGWEFPPFISGGLGTACYGLTRALDRQGHEVLFVLPKAVDRSFASHVQLLSPDAPPPIPGVIPPVREAGSATTPPASAAAPERAGGPEVVEGASRYRDEQFS